MSWWAQLWKEDARTGRRVNREMTAIVESCGAVIRQMAEELAKLRATNAVVDAAEAWLKLDDELGGNRVEMANEAREHFRLRLGELRKPAKGDS